MLGRIHPQYQLSLPFRQSRAVGRGRLVFVSTSLALLALLFILSSNQQWVESLYAHTLFPFLQKFLQAMAGLFPFSLAELIIGATLLWLATAGIRLSINLTRAERPGRLALGFFTTVASLFLAGAVCGYLFWGLSYSRPPALERLGWDDPVDKDTPSADLQELVQLAVESVELVNHSYREATGVVDLGVPSTPRTRLAELDRQLEMGFQRVARVLQLDPAMAMKGAAAKPIVSSPLLSYLGIAGFYFPWTGEANFNRLQPACERFHSIAHEKAHQRGIAGEDEAGFFGFLACLYSDDPYLHYSGFLFATQQLLNELWPRDPTKAGRIHAMKLVGVRRDEKAVYDFWNAYQGWASDVGERVNDAYLKFHGVEQGIESYSESSRLLVLMARRNGGSLAIPAKRVWNR